MEGWYKLFSHIETNPSLSTMQLIRLRGERHQDLSSLKEKGYLASPRQMSERESKRERDPLTVVFNNAMAVTPSPFGQEYLLGCVNSRRGQRKSRNLNPCSQYSFWRHVYANRPIVRVPIFAPVSRSPSFLRRLPLILFFARSPL